MIEVMTNHPQFRLEHFKAFGVTGALLDRGKATDRNMPFAHYTEVTLAEAREQDNGRFIVQGFFTDPSNVLFRMTRAFLYAFDDEQAAKEWADQLMALRALASGTQLCNLVPRPVSQVRKYRVRVENVVMAASPEEAAKLFLSQADCESEALVIWEDRYLADPNDTGWQEVEVI